MEITSVMFLKEADSIVVIFNDENGKKTMLCLAKEPPENLNMFDGNFVQIVGDIFKYISPELKGEVEKFIYNKKEGA